MDTITALVAAVLIIVANAAVLGLMLRRFSSDLRSAVISWHVGTMLIAAGCVPFILSSHLPMAIVSLLGNCLLMLGLVAYSRALRQFYGYGPGAVWLLPVIGGMLAVAWFAIIDPQAKVRIMIVTVVWLALMWASVKILRAQKDVDKTLSRQVLMSVFVGVMLFTAVRAIYYSQVDLEPTFSVVDNSRWMNLITAMLEVILPIIGTTAFALMCAQRTHEQSEPAAHSADTLSYIGHDLRAPLATIVGYAQLLSESGTPEQARHIRAIERSANYQLTLIDEILEYATQGKTHPFDIQAVPVSLGPLLEDVIQHAVSLSRRQRNQFEFDAGTPLPARVSTDPARLQQILLNLISNAAKFTRNGVIRLTVRTNIRDGRGHLVFAVTDTGSGIDPQAQSKIFQRFEQIEKHAGSAGLGLYIVQRIVKNLGGQLHLDSTPGKGSCFTFEIPADPFSSEAAKLPAYRSAASISAAMPTAEHCTDLARLARNGQLSDIESWLREQSSTFGGSRDFIDEVATALEMLDFERIEAMALTAAQQKRA